MSELDDLFHTDDPEVQAALVVVQKHAKYHNNHPEQCPHHAIVAPVIRDKGEQPGSCLDCGADFVMERETDCPLCRDEGSA